ncbi:MAG: hypothetical protein CL910_02530 [Deltaproteobacteria bacterium]|jgi:hypothetical protein|nr:hypothetical protein [Deltaproteobacteria bacterium]
MVSVARRDAPELGLEAIYVAAGSDAARGAVVAPPHPLYGGSMDSPVVNEVAYACFSAEMDTTRFNWRGVGASSGEPSGEAKDADADYGSALDHAALGVPGKLVGCGYSFGAAAAVRVAGRHPRVKQLVLVAPPPALISPDEIAATGKEVLIVTGADDDLAPAGALQSALADSPGVEIVILPGTDHFFGRGLADLARVTSTWLTR